MSVCTDCVQDLAEDSSALLDQIVRLARSRRLRPIEEAMDHCGVGSRVAAGQRVGWRLAALRGPHLNISAMAIAPAIRPRQIGTISGAGGSPPACRTSVWATASAVLQGQWKRDGNSGSLLAGVAAHRRQPARLPHASSPSPDGCSGRRQPSQLVYKALRYTATNALEPLRGAGFSGARFSVFQQHFSAGAHPGAEAEAAGLGRSTPPGRTFTVSFRLSALRQARRPARRTGPLGANASFLSSPGRRPRKRSRGGSLRLHSGLFARSLQTLGLPIQLERAPPPEAG